MEKAKNKKSEDRPKSRPKLLLVEDQVAIRNLYHLFLEQQAFEVLTAGGVSEAARMAEQEHFDCALVDIYLGDGNGLELVKTLKKERALKTVLMTGYGTEENLKTLAVAVKADGWHSKTRGMNQLLQEIQRVIGNGEVKALRKAAPESQRDML